ncbi:hypothetical protein Tco_0757807 [Tanacetum coccineum]
MLTSDLLRPGLVKLVVLKNLVHHSMSSWIPHSTSLHLNRLNIKDLTQEILIGPAFELLKGTCKSLTELMYHLEECSKDHPGRQVIPQDFFINNDLEYLKGGDLSRRYSTSVMKTNAATNEIKWIEDLVRNLWSPMKVIYDKHAYLGTSHWGPKRQRFYGFASNMTSSKDVYSRRRIITVTRLTIMKKYDYGHLEMIEVRQEDQQRDGTLNDVRTALHDIPKGIRMEYLPKRK